MGGPHALPPPHDLRFKKSPCQIGLIFGFIMVTYKFNTVTLNKSTNELVPKGSSTIDMACILAQQSFYLKTKTFSDDFFKSTWQGLRLQCFALQQTPDQSFSLFQLLCQKNKVLHRIKFDQEIFTKLLKTMHQLTINLLCSSDYRTTYSFCEIKHFVKQAKSLLIHFQGLLLKNITCVIISFLVLRVL